jgi:predicted transcriptional regulator
MNKSRTRIELMHDILGLVNNQRGNTKPKHIGSGSHLSSKITDKYLNELTRKRFLIEKELENGKIYSISPKGYTFLDKYELIQEFSSSFGLNLSSN